MAAKRWADRGVRIVGIAVDLGSADEVARLAGEWDIRYESWWIHPGAHERAQRLMPEGLPTSFAIWKDRVVRHARFLDMAGLEALMRQLDVSAPE